MSLADGSGPPTGGRISGDQPGNDLLHFIRMWHFYLAACEAYFATRRLGDLQLVLTRPGNLSLRGLPAHRSVAA